MMDRIREGQNRILSELLAHYECVQKRENWEIRSGTVVRHGIDGYQKYLCD